MKYCTKCGNTMPDEAAFCGKCGAKYDNISAGTVSQQPVTNNQGSQSQNNPMALIGFILSAAGLLFLTLCMIDAFFALFGTALGAGGLVLSILSKKISIDMKNKLGFIFSIIALGGNFIAAMVYFMTGAI